VYSTPGIIAFAMPLIVVKVSEFMGFAYHKTARGARVMVTVGQKITHLTPGRGLAAELSAALTV